MLNSVRNSINIQEAISLNNEAKIPSKVIDLEKKVKTENFSPFLGTRLYGQSLIQIASNTVVPKFKNA